MIAGIKTAAEARADAIALQTINAVPNSVGVKVFNNFLLRLMQYQAENPTATTANIPASFGMIIPTAAISYIEATFGYKLTTQPSTAPEGYTGLIASWSLVTQVSWEDIAIGDNRRMVLSGDVTNSTVNLADAGLQFSVKAGETYYFKAFIPYTSAVTTTGSRWVLDGPTAVMSYRSSYPLTATTQTTNFLSAYNLPATANATSILTGSAVFEGVIAPSASGIVKIRFASEVAGSAIVARTGSVLEWVRTI